MGLYNNDDYGVSQASDTDVISTWADCIIKIIGWFQISGTLNPATNNYLPESDASGNPISGPGWVAYEKPGAQPGDIVLIYTLETMLLNNQTPNNLQISSVLWDLLSPGGLAYWINNAGLKLSVSLSDIISQFPHPGNALSPSNPQSYMDLIWTKVTTHYQLPGPGNANAPGYIRDVLPGFGMRILVWTESCCVASNITTFPPGPPPITGEIPPITSEPHGTGFSDPDPEYFTSPSIGSSSSASSYAGVSSYSNIQANIATGDLTKLTPNASRFKNKDPEPTNFKHNSYYHNINTRLPIGHAPVPRSQGNTKAMNTYDVPANHPLPWLDRVGDYDYHTSIRARPIGSRYLLVKEGKVNPLLLPNRVKWNISVDRNTLYQLGLAGNAPYQGTRNRVAAIKPEIVPEGRAGVSIGHNHKNSLVQNPLNNNSPSADPVKPSGISYKNQDRTIYNGYINKPTSSSDVEFLTSSRIIGDGQKVFNTKRKLPQAIKSIKQEESGKTFKDQAGNPGLAYLRKRTFDISKVKQATKAASYQFFVYKGRAIGLQDIRKDINNLSFKNIPDPNGKFTICPYVYKGGQTWSYVTLVCGNVQNEQHLVLKQSIVLSTSGGSIVGNLGSSGVITFGRVNPVQPGMYVVANPSCLPGQDSLPDIIAGGETWSFGLIVSTLLTLEGQVITQQITNFLPAAPGDTDVQAPNRLPVGLMRDLELDDTSSFLYDGTYSERGTNQSTWYKNEPSVIVQRDGSTSESVSIVLKTTRTSQDQLTPFRPVLEIYNEGVLLATGATAAFIGGPCSAQPGWVGMTAGSINTTCAGSNGYGGAGGSSAYITNSAGAIMSGPYNPAVYGGSHSNFLYFKYDSSNPAGSDSTYIDGVSQYRIRVHNNGPVNDYNGYVLYTNGIEIVPATSSLNIVSGNLEGSVVTYHCNQDLLVVNDSTKEQIEKRSSYTNGGIILTYSDAFSVKSGDIIKIFRPGFDNEYHSQKSIIDITI